VICDIPVHANASKINFWNIKWLVTVVLPLIKPCWYIDTDGESNGVIFLDIIDSNILGIKESKQIG